MMQRSPRRRDYTTSEIFYHILDDSLPIRPSFTISVIAIAVMAAVFIMSCFTAAVLGSAEEKLAASEKRAQYCTDYYAAETTAADILSILASDNSESLADENGELKYTENEYEITISRNGGNFSFDVPVTKKESLHVIARITEGNTEIISQYTK